jgi:hypothetical protein
MPLSNIPIGNAGEYPFAAGYGAQVVATLPFINPKDASYNASGNGFADDRAALAAADAAAVLAVLPLVISSGTYYIATDLTLSAQVVFAGGVLKPARTAQITVVNVQAGLRQIFDTTPTNLTGTVTVTKDSTAVTGIGTHFATELASAVATGQGCIVKVDNHYGMVGSITNDTAFVLAYVWSGPTTGGATMAGAGRCRLGYSSTGMHPEWWGVIDNDVNNAPVAPYDTLAVQSAIAANPAAVPLVFGRNYNVTTVNIGGSNPQVEAAGYQLIGVSADAATDAILQIQSSYGNLQNIRVNGNFNTDYRSAVHWFGDVLHQSPNFNEFDGLEIDNALMGLVIGGHVTYNTNTTDYTVDTPYDCPASETTFRKFRTHGVRSCITVNQPNGKIHFDQPAIVASQNEWAQVAPASWDYAKSYCILNVPNRAGLFITGGSIESGDSADATAIGIRGAGIVVDGAIWECYGLDGRIEGGCLISNASNGGGAAANKFVIAATLPVGGAAVTGQLQLDRNSHSRNTDGGALVASLSASFNYGFTVKIRDCALGKWQWLNGVTPIVSGAILEWGDGNLFSHTAAPIETSLKIKSNRESIFTTADPVGNSMDNTLDLNAKGGWTVGGGFGIGGGFRGVVAPVPTGIAGAIELTTVGGGADGWIDSPTGASGFRVEPGTSRIFQCFLEAPIATGQMIGITIFWWKYDGSASATASTGLLYAGPGSTTMNSFIGVSQYVTVPIDAAFASIQLEQQGAGTSYISAIRF